MRCKLLSVALLTVIGLLCTQGGDAKAGEGATIKNESNHAVAIVLKWTHLPVDSGVIVLAPGQSCTTQGPDGQTLFVRFNATPTNSQFPKIVDLRVITRFTGNPIDPGMVSVFRNISDYEVRLVLP